MPGGLGSWLLYVYQNNATPPVVVDTGMGFGGGSRYQAPATTVSRGMVKMGQLSRLKRMRKSR